MVSTTIKKRYIHTVLRLVPNYEAAGPGVEVSSNSPLSSLLRLLLLLYPGIDLREAWRVRLISSSDINRLVTYADHILCHS